MRVPAPFSAILRGLLAAIVIPLTASAQSDAVDITAAFIKRGAVIEDLKVVQISDNVVIRGKTNDGNKAAKAGRIAASLGHLRVANLIAIRNDATDDAAIAYIGRRQLELESSLEGCRFRVRSKLGAVELTGRVRREMQADLAVAILSRIEGVKTVHADLAHP
jgi:osmotically-inducible protein OsmY